MRVLGLSLVPFLLSSALAQDDLDFDFAGCSKADAPQKCSETIDGVVPVTPGRAYWSTIACKDCPYAETRNAEDDGKPETRVTHGDQELFFNVTLANDTRSLYLNGKKIFPLLATIPSPPHIAVPLLHPGVSYTNLSAAAACSDPTCTGKISSDCTEWCALPLARMFADFSYSAHIQREEADAGIRYWDVVFDPVGGRSAVASASTPAWKLDDPDRKALHIVVAGQLVRGKTIKKHNSQDGGLFGSSSDGEDYDLEIAKVEHVMRRFEFASPSLGFFGTIRRFFGGDVWKAEGELVYLSDEWSVWGKKGTLRNWVGRVFHSTFVGLVFIILGSIVGGFIALRIVHSLWLFAKQQSGLARWKGIDAVYSQLNQDRSDDDDDHWDEQGQWSEHGQWSEQTPWTSRAHFTDRSPATTPSTTSTADFRSDYRDSFDSAPRASSAWQAERMKPLPTKPLPEKPLPSEPLIDT
ncbi:hypothetical protein C7974DRAFT_410764 [Boeremia exigua]|uniref:uncharacterized protein n=1 Tax=Boeremia exigua TaxID=749465 RepID=UPI001E8D670C|nr:uncharacterized protein C7974DRAFT_410764 [Boeremia exigua]KAH6639810.1 hypothetical protein C7974DRAFT_410764 [Boeremia exigua]